MGASATYAGYGFLDWGSQKANAENIPATPPASALNDDFTALVTAVASSNQMTLSVPPNPGAAGIIYHDDTPAWNALQSYCHARPTQSCGVKVGAGTTRNLYFNQTSALTIEGEDIQTSQILLFGTSNAYATNSQAVGGQWQNFASGGGLRLHHLAIYSDNTGGDVIHSCCHWIDFDVQDVDFSGPQGSYIRRAFMTGGAEGMYSAIHRTSFMQDLSCGNCNGLVTSPGYNAWYQNWPGVMLYNAFEYCGYGQGPWTVFNAVFKNAWNAISPCNAAAAGTSGGGYLQGGFIEGNYDADLSDSVSNFPVRLANAVGAGDVFPQGVVFTIDAESNFRIGANDYIGASGPTTKIGCVWGQSFFPSELSVHDLACITRGFGLISDAPVDARSDSFSDLQTPIPNWPWTGIGISTSAPGSTIENNTVQGRDRYQVGYKDNVRAHTCAIDDAFTVKFNTGMPWVQSLSTILNACPTATIEPVNQLTTVSTNASGSGNVLAALPNFKCTNQDVTTTSASKITLAPPTYANQCELVKVCQNSIGGFGPTFAVAPGLNITDTFPTCTTMLTSVAISK